ncbi:ComF family protein [Chromatiaceae bacterium AAb-1]|nr:ComF family protein [Chromatiaceae bacterium AAb-1]
MLKRFLAILRYLWHQLLPSDCLWCSLPVQHYNHQLCSVCSNALPELPYTLCHYNLLWLPAVASGLKNVQFDYLLSLALYQQPYRHWIQQWKFRQQLAAGELLQQEFCQLLSAYQQAGNPVPQAILYVPMHPSRQRKRGFNQAQQLAKAISDHLHLPLLHELKRTKPVPAQVGLGRKQRQQNLRSAFTINTSCRLPAHVALIDDVITTGATANQLCRLLKQQGATTISLWTLAVTPASP